MTQTSKPLINAKAQAILDQLAPGVTIEHLRNGALGIVDRIEERSVWFTNGKYENKRSLGNYKIV